MLPRGLRTTLLLVLIAPLGFALGLFGTRVVQRLTAQLPVREGDFAAYVAEVGSPVVLISSSTCPWCAKTREWLEARHVSYRDCVMDQDEYAQALFRRLDGQAVPVILTSHAVVTGFDTALFERVLALTGMPAPAPAGSTRCAPGG